MILGKIKKISLLFCLGIVFVIAQENKEGENILAEFDQVAAMAGNDIRNAIYGGVIPADIAITAFAAYGFTPQEKKYFEEVMNRIFYSDVSFKLLSIPESQTIQVEKAGDKLIIKKGASKNQDLKKYAESINSKHYGEIYIYLMPSAIYMKFLVHDADTGDVVWSRSWSVKRDDRFTAEFGYMMEYAITTGNLHHYLHTFFGARSIGLGEFGVSIDVGGYHQKELFNPPPASGDKLIGDIGASIIFAPKVSINILELAKVSYAGIDFYGIIKPGLRVDLLIKTDSAGNSNRQVLKPYFNFAGNVGIGIGFRRINIDILADVNPKGGYFLSAALYYKL